MSEVKTVEPSSVVAMSEVVATMHLTELGVPWRITCRDGAHYAVTRDHVPERLNLIILNGIVNDAYRG